MSDDKTTIIKSDTDIFKKMIEAAGCIELFYKGKEYRFTREQLPLSIGRDTESCTIVSTSTMTSRVHCKIEVRESQIGITDSSTNGTYIKIGRSDSILIKNSFYPLTSQGNISLGEPIDLSLPELFHFRICSETK